jgi:hypothetical protein
VYIALEFGIKICSESRRRPWNSYKADSGIKKVRMTEIK